MYSTVSPFSRANFASASAAAMHISSVIVRARTSRAPRKIPGKPSELLTWFGRTERPVATTRAPASFASQGHTSGIGLGHAKIIESFAIVDTHSFLIVSGPGLDR